STTLQGGTLTATAGVNIQAGTLIGNGTVNGNVVNQGILSPGNSPGTIQVNGNFTQAAAGTFAVELNGTAATQYDQLDVHGTVSLNGPLSLAVGFLPAVGDSFKIINNDLTGPVGGAFTGLPQTGIITVPGCDDYPMRFQINYFGGDGNDVVLTHINTPPS